MTIRFAPAPLALSLLLLGMLAPGAPGCPQGGAAQEVENLTLPDSLLIQEQELPDSLTEAPGPRRVSPGGAFLRSALIPGWGHAAAGSFTRGGFYLMGQGMTGWMLYKTRTRQNQARETTRILEQEAEARFLAEGITDPDTLAVLIEEDEAVAGARALEELRAEQWEDWMALGIFLILLGGADAFVSAHLAEFPAPLSVDASPEGRIQIGVSIPLGRPPP